MEVRFHCVMGWKLQQNHTFVVVLYKTNKNTTQVRFLFDSQPITQGIVFSLSIKKTEKKCKEKENVWWEEWRKGWEKCTEEHFYLLQLLFKKW